MRALKRFLNHLLSGCSPDSILKYFRNGDCMKIRSSFLKPLKNGQKNPSFYRDKNNHASDYFFLILWMMQIQKTMGAFSRF